MSTIKVNEVRHLDNTGDANVVLSSTGATTLKSATISALTVESITASGTVNLNGNNVLGNASSDTLDLLATTKGSHNYAGFTGEVRMWSGASAPTTWLICNGATIGNNASGATHTPSTTGISLQPLFDHLKTSWGNQGTESYTNNNTVKLPDFKGRVAVGVGQQDDVKWNSSSSNYTSSGTNITLGHTGGLEEHVLTTAQLAAHNHGASATTETTGISATTTLNNGTVGQAPSASAEITNHSHTITDPTHSHAHTHNHTHTHATDDSEATFTIDSKNLAHTHPGPSHQHVYFGDDAAATIAGHTQVQNNLYDAHSTISSGNDGGRFKTEAAGTGNTGAMSANASHSHGFSGYVGNPKDFSGNAQASTGSATAHAQATGITVDSTTNSTKPTVTVTLSLGAGTAITDNGHDHTITTTNTGSGSPHNNLQPYLGINYIIKI